MNRITFKADSLVDIAIAHYMDDYERKYGHKCTKSYAINALIGMGDTMRIMNNQKKENV